MLLSRGSIYPFSHASFRWSTLFARYDRSSFLFFLLSLPLPFVLTGGQRDMLLLLCLLASISLLIPWQRSLLSSMPRSRTASATLTCTCRHATLQLTSHSPSTATS